MRCWTIASCVTIRVPSMFFAPSILTFDASTACTSSFLTHTTSPRDAS
jgi:hypothetical protein